MYVTAPLPELVKVFVTVLEVVFTFLLELAKFKVGVCLATLRVNVCVPALYAAVTEEATVIVAEPPPTIVTTPVEASTVATLLLLDE